MIGLIFFSKSSRSKMKENSSESKKDHELFLGKKWNWSPNIYSEYCEECWCCSPKQSALPGSGENRTSGLPAGRVGLCDLFWSVSRELKWHVSLPGQNILLLMQYAEFPIPCDTVACNSRWQLLSHPGSLRESQDHSHLAWTCNVGEQQIFIVWATNIL